MSVKYGAKREPVSFYYQIRIHVCSFAIFKLVALTLTQFCVIKRLVGLFLFETCLMFSFFLKINKKRLPKIASSKSILKLIYLLYPGWEALEIEKLIIIPFFGGNHFDNYLILLIQLILVNI